MVEATLRALNPLARMLPAIHGALRAPLRQSAMAGHAQAAMPRAAAAWDMTIDEATGLVDQRRRRSATGCARLRHLEHARLAGSCDPQLLQELLEAVADGAFGQIERMKGVVRAGAGWVRFDCSGGRPTLAAFAPRTDEMPRLVAVGRDIDRVRLQAAFAACATSPARMNRT